MCFGHVFFVLHIKISRGLLVYYHLTPNQRALGKAANELRKGGNSSFC